MTRRFFPLLTVALLLSGSVSQALIIDHTCCDIAQVPVDFVTAAKDQFRIWYGHTSHGSQITTGMQMVQTEIGTPFTYNAGAGSLSYTETGGDLGHNGDLTWEQSTRAQLNDPANDRNMVMWSWCGGVSDNTVEGINTYLDAMNQLESDYPDVTFLYMTGHLDGTGEEGNLHLRNNQIRDYCRTNDKLLFDFADIESYDPDGNYFLDRGARDTCDYDSGNWADEWCAANAGQCPSCGSCAHSRCLNCWLKGQAFWWMMARLAGWSGPQTATATPTPPPPITFMPDLNGDGQVTAADLLIFQGAWHQLEP